jgi:hypothetical protein
MTYDRIMAGDQRFCNRAIAGEHSSRVELNPPTAHREDPKNRRDEENQLICNLQLLAGRAKGAVNEPR